MASARIISIAAGLTVQARDVDGAWRDLDEEDEIGDQEEIKVSASGPQFALTAYKLQRRSGGAWTDAVTVTLDARSGSSHWRQDKYQVEGDEDDSTVAALLTVGKGNRFTRDALICLQVQQTDAGGRYAYPDSLPGGPTQRTYKGVFSQTTKTNELDEGGFRPTEDATIISDREQYATAGTAPELGQEIVWYDGSAKYRIVRLEVDEISYTLGLASVHR